MTSIPFLIPITNSLAGNASQDFAYTVNTAWVLHIKKMWFISTGAFSIYGITDGTGRQYSNATVGTPILSTFVQSPATAFLSFLYFEVEILLNAANTFRVSIKDTSGSTNVINMLLSCIADVNQ